MAMLSTKNKFQCEKELLDGLLDRSKFLEEKSISANATSIIELCRKNKSDRTMPVSYTHLTLPTILLV